MRLQDPCRTHPCLLSLAHRLTHSPYVAPLQSSAAFLVALSAQQSLRITFPTRALPDDTVLVRFQAVLLPLPSQATMLSPRGQQAKSALAESIPSRATVRFPVVQLQKPTRIEPLHRDNNLQVPGPGSPHAHQVMVQFPPALQKADTCSVKLVVRRPPSQIWTVLPALAGPAALCGRTANECDSVRLRIFHTRCESCSLFTFLCLLTNDTAV